MAVDTIDPVSGRPIFLDSGAPDIAVDDNEVAEYASLVGNRATGTTAQRNAWAYRKEQFAWGDTTDGHEYKVVDGAWVQQPRTSAWVKPALEPGWTVFSNGEFAQFCITSGLVTLGGRVNASAGAATKILQLPVGFRPSATLVTNLYADFGGSIGQINPDGGVFLANKSGAAQAVSLASFPAFRGY